MTIAKRSEKRFQHSQWNSARETLTDRAGMQANVEHGLVAGKSSWGGGCPQILPFHKGTPRNLFPMTPPATGLVEQCNPLGTYVFEKGPPNEKLIPAVNAQRSLTSGRQ